MLNQLFKNENFDIKNPLTIMIIFFLLSLIVVSKYYYRRLTIENNQNMFDDTKGINELLEQYAEKYESGDTYHFSAMEILYLNKKRDLVERIEGLWSEKQFRDQFK